MATLQFRTEDLAKYYLYGSTTANTDFINALSGWRNAGGDLGTQNEVAAFDSRVANFQNIITDNVKPGSEDLPYDATYLKREFMEELFGMLMKRSAYRGTFLRFVAQPFPVPGAAATTSPVMSSGLLDPSVYYSAIPTQFGYDQGPIIWDGRNLSNMSLDTLRGTLSTEGQRVWDSYVAWMNKVFEEGNKLDDAPKDPTTGSTLNAVSVTAITERIINGITYDRVAYDGAKYYLVSKGASTYTNSKGQLQSYRVNADGSITSNAGAIDTLITFNASSLSSAYYLEVSSELIPVPGAVAASLQKRNLSPAWYIYYWNEARIKVLRAQLAYKEAVTTEIRDDLAKANAAFANLEEQAAGTRAQSPDGKTMNPDTTAETLLMNIFYATNAKQGTTYLVDRTGADTIHNFGDWQNNRSMLKTYIDLKSTQSQDAMLDYQTTLNRYNNAYEVMSKLQEKMDGLVKSQLRNVS